MFSRGSGILMHISSLPSPDGIGDMGDWAYRFADMLMKAGQSYWQVLPLTPTTSLCGHSPYFSSSAFAGNPLLISLPYLVEDGLLDKSDMLAPVDPEATDVDFKTVCKRKLPLLDKAYDRFIELGKRDELDEFCRQQASWLEDYTLFMAIKEAHGVENSWQHWPEALKKRDPDALTAARTELADSIDREKFRQFIFFRQWFRLKKYCNEHGIQMIGDIPIYVSYDSADVWVNPSIFKLDEQRRPTVVSGVPPDYFSETGQLWNNPVYRWSALEESSFDWWVRRMDAVFSRYDIVRIDHFRGLVQYWEVPAGEQTAINGSWQDVPTYEFFNTMVRRFPDFPVIAEDLGTITPDVREVMERFAFPGMKVLMFAFGEDNPENPYLPHNYEQNCLVYTGTHDNNTFRGWFENEAGDEEKARLFGYLGRTMEVTEAASELIRLAMMSVASIAITPVQDLLVLPVRARMNQPAQTHGNWKWRLTQSEFDRMPVSWLGELTERYGRKL